VIAKRVEWIEARVKEVEIELKENPAS